MLDRVLIEIPQLLQVLHQPLLLLGLELWAILIAELLSQNNFIGPSYFTLRSTRIIFIHNPSHIPCVMAQNSASTLDQATTFCFLLLQEYLPPAQTIELAPQWSYQEYLHPTQTFGLALGP
ncbi:hypothetical protein CR513_27619, partial [Mucuna pruriens]